MATIKQKLGFTLHENMSVREMTRIWNDNATEEVKAEFPEFDILMQQCTTQLALALDARNLEVTLKNIVEATKDLMEDATAALTGFPALLIQKVNSLAQTAVALFELNTSNAKRDEILEELAEIENC